MTRSSTGHVKYLPGVCWIFRSKCSHWKTSHQATHKPCQQNCQLLPYSGDLVKEYNTLWYLYIHQIVKHSAICVSKRSSMPRMRQPIWVSRIILCDNLTRKVSALELHRFCNDNSCSDHSAINKSKWQLPRLLQWNVLWPWCTRSPGQESRCFQKHCCGLCGFV